MDNIYEHFASDHRGRPLHAGKRTHQGLFGNLDYVGKPVRTPYWADPYGGQDEAGPAMANAPRKPSPKGPGSAGAAKGY